MFIVEGEVEAESRHHESVPLCSHCGFIVFSMPSGKISSQVIYIMIMEQCANILQRKVKLHQCISKIHKSKVKVFRKPMRAVNERHCAVEQVPAAFLWFQTRGQARAGRKSYIYIFVSILATDQCHVTGCPPLCTRVFNVFQINVLKYKYKAVENGNVQTSQC